jgi:hypothetical protein
MELTYFQRWGWRFHLRYLVPHILYSGFCLVRWGWRGRGATAVRAKWQAAKIILQQGFERAGDMS